MSLESFEGSGVSFNAIAGLHLEDGHVGASLLSTVSCSKCLFEGLLESLKSGERINLIIVENLVGEVGRPSARSSTLNKPKSEKDTSLLVSDRETAGLELKAGADRSNEGFDLVAISAKGSRISNLGFARVRGRGNALRRLSGLFGHALGNSLNDLIKVKRRLSKLLLQLGDLLLERLDKSLEESLDCASMFAELAEEVGLWLWLLWIHRI
jgi:hypothetical protein